MNFTNYLYESIGNRVKRLRRSMNLTQESIEGIDTSILSRIENGKAVPQKNPYLMNNWQIKILSETYKVDEKTIVWGTREEQQDFVKMILLSVLMSCNCQTFINPFCYLESEPTFFTWANKQGIVPLELKGTIEFIRRAPEGIKSIKDEEPKEFYEKFLMNLKKEDVLAELIKLFDEKYDFFYSRENYDKYQKHLSTIDAELQPLSDALFKQLLQNYQFTVGYTKRVTNYIFNKNAQSDTFDEQLGEVLIHPSKYMNIALDYKEYEYCNFIFAFNQMWKNHSEEYMKFFDKMLFDNQWIYESGLKKFQNENFQTILKSKEFYDICYGFSIIDSYKNPEAILASNYFTLCIQQVVQRKLSFLTNTANNLVLSHICKSIQETEECARNEIHIMK